MRKTFDRISEMMSFRICGSIVVLLTIILAQNVFVGTVKSQSYTHSVFVEIFASSWCDPCRDEQSAIRKLSENNTHAAHFVVYHLQDMWSTEDAVSRANEFGFNFVPSHACDGGYSRTSGAIMQTPEVQSTASRSVHLIELTVTKAVNGNVLYVQVSITERNGYPFSGEVVAYVTENKINVNGTEWNSAYRGRVISQGVYLKPNSYSALYGNWSIPSDSRSNMLEVIAVAFDRNSQGKYGPYAVQSASEKDRNLAIPEFGGWLFLLTFSTLFITASILRRSFKRGTVA
jgi:thiol-disulfide isomerase/thioredoxin